MLFSFFYCFRKSVDSNSYLLSHYDTKVHKALLFSIINLVKLRGFVPLWQKRLFGVDLVAILYFYVIGVDSLLRFSKS